MLVSQASNVTRSSHYITVRCKIVLLKITFAIASLVTSRRHSVFLFLSGGPPPPPISLASRRCGKENDLLGRAMSLDNERTELLSANLAEQVIPGAALSAPRQLYSLLQVK